jgi:CubicO group peptidase (beta-lactamase class C family)
MSNIVKTIVGLVSLVAVALLLQLDWGLWKRWLNRPNDLGEWPDSFYQPMAVIPGGDRPFFDHAAAAELTISPAALDQAAEYARAHNSAALLVLHRGRVQLERYWQDIGPASLFSGRAMTRSMLGPLVGVALADGALTSVDEPVSAYLPEWAGDARGAITVRQLLTNTSGLENPPLDAGGPFAKNTRITMGSDFAAAALDYELEHEPGTFFAVSNANAQLVGVILERATGMAYEDYLAEKLWTPMGAGKAQIYMDTEAGMPAVYCCYRATPRDWLRLGALLLNDGVVDGRRLWPEGWLAEVTRGSRLNPNYGYQIWVGNPGGETRAYVQDSGPLFPHGPPIAAQDVFFAEGGGFRTLYVIPSQELVILRLGYTDASWQTSALPNIILEGITAETPSPP